MLWPDFLVPMVNEEQIEGYSYLNKRYNHGIFVFGDREAGRDHAAGIDDLNASPHRWRSSTRPSDDHLGARLVKPGLLGDVLGGPAQRFWRDSVAGDAGAGGGMRESGKHLCGARGRSRPRDWRFGWLLARPGGGCCARCWPRLRCCRSRAERQAHSVAGALLQRIEPVATDPRVSDSRDRGRGCARVWDCRAAGRGQRRACPPC